MTEPQREIYVGDLCAKLAEHCEACQIMLSWDEDGLTKSYFHGAGNWYARQGMARAFMNRDVAQENAHELAEQINPPPENWREEG